MRRILIINFTVILHTIFSYQASALSDIPYESNDNSYVYVQNPQYIEDNEDISFKVFNKIDIRPFSIPDCTSIPLDFTECKKNICGSNSPFGRVYHKTDGFSQKKLCQYEERTPQFGGIDCLIKAEDFQNMAELLNKSLNFLEEKIYPLTEEESTNLSIMIKNYCKPVADDELISPITINTALDNDPQLKPLNITNAEKRPNSNSHPDPSNASSNLKLSQFIPQSYLTSKSIMFTKEELEEIAQYAENIKTPQEIGKMRQNLAANKTYIFNSIIFLESDKWIIWINDHKISKGEKVPDFDILSVNKSTIVLKFTVKSINKTMPLWEKKFLYDNPSRYTNKNNTIQLNKDSDGNAIVLATLSPHQSFELTNLYIAESNN